MSTKKVSRSRRKYDSTFKEDVIKMVASGRPISEISQALGVSVSLIHRWYKSSYHTATTPANGGALSGSQDPSVNEIERLRAELRRTEQERDILKKALGIFSRGT